MGGEVDGIGTIAAGGIAAHAIDRAADPGTTGHGHAGAGGTCPNCGAIRRATIAGIADGPATPAATS